jgi:hypothetical protein
MRLACISKKLEVEMTEFVVRQRDGKEVTFATVTEAFEKGAVKPRFAPDLQAFPQVWVKAGGLYYGPVHRP